MFQVATGRTPSVTKRARETKTFRKAHRERRAGFHRPPFPFRQMFRIYYLIPILIPLALVKGDSLGRLFRPADRALRRVALRPGRAIWLVAGVSFALNVLLALGTRIPEPHVNDEFGYLLLGDTFAHGRVTNPTPPLWEHFETIYELMQPSYTAIYPPGQGVALAVGEKLGLPILGVWLTTALACGAMCWMLQAWVPGRWAVAGGLMVALHPQVLEWSHDYWGGSVAMGGGALVLGAYKRLAREPQAGNALWLGAGLGVLANSRPYEGFVLGVVVLTALAAAHVRNRTPLGVVFSQLILPMAAVLMLAGGMMAFYNWRVTGNAALLPHMLNDQSYGIAPQFIFGKPRPEPVYRVPEIRRIYEDYLWSFEAQRRSAGALARATFSKLWTIAQGYLWSYLMALALLALPLALAHDRRLWVVVAMGGVFLAAQLLTSWVFPHYAAPAAGIFFVLVVASMRALYAVRIGERRIGRNIVRGMALIFLASFFNVWVRMAGKDAGAWYLQRAAVLERLRQAPEKSLLIVRYTPRHNPNREWVYNDSDIPGEKVIVARDMGERNRELLNYFRDRKVWIVEADAAQPELEPYPGS